MARSYLAQQRILEDVLSDYRSRLDLRVQDVEVQRVIDYVHHHLFDETLTVAGTLDACGIRSHTFSARFKWEMIRTGKGNLTMQRYIERLRIGAAVKLLAWRDLEVLMIAISLGFGSHERFLRAWHRYFTPPPTVYRRSQRVPVVGENAGA